MIFFDNFIMMGGFYWYNTTAFSRAINNFSVVMIQRLLLPAIAISTLFKILHGIKYQVFAAYGISKL